MEPQNKPVDVITDSLLTEAREALPAWVVADTPDGPAISRSNEPPDDKTEAWVVTEGEDSMSTMSEIMQRFGVENVLLYLEPEPWDLAVGEIIQPETDDDIRKRDRVDPIHTPTNVDTNTEGGVPAPVTAGLNDEGQIPWSHGPIAALIDRRTSEAIEVLTNETVRLEARLAHIAAAGPGAVAPAAPDEDLARMVFGAPDASIDNTMSAAVLGNAEAQQALVKIWKAAFTPGMTRDELAAATLPPRPTDSMAATEVWDAVVHEADVWLANQNGTEPPVEGEPETPNPPVRPVEVPAIVPLVDPAQPAARTAASGMRSGGKGGSSILTEAEHRQRRDAARISADRRRKQREQERRQRAMKLKKRADGVMTSDFQEAMSAFSRNGVTGRDLTQGNNGYVRGNDSGAHERLLNSAHESGYEIQTYADGSGFAKKGGHTIQLGSPGDGSRWSGDGVRLDQGDPRQPGGRYRTPYEKPKKPKAPKKPPRWRSAWGGSKRR